MKKLSAIFFALLLVFAFVCHVEAKTEQDLIDELSKSVELSNGKEYKLESDDLNAAKQYLNKYELTSTEVDYILEQIEAAKKIIKKEDTGVYAKFSTENQKALKKLVENVAKYTTVDAEAKNGNVIVYNTDENGNRLEPFHKSDKLVTSGRLAQTGSSNTMTILASISLLIVLIGTVLVAKEIKTNK